MNWENIDTSARRIAARAVCRLFGEEINVEGQEEGLFRELTETSLFEEEMRRRSRYNAGKAFRKAKGRRRLHPVRWYGAAACALVMALGGWWLLRTGQSADGGALVGEYGIHGSRQICLQLSDGKRVALCSEDTLQLQEQDKTIEVRGGEIAYSGERKADSWEEVWNTLTVPKGAEFRIKLSDGTVVHLNADSRLQYPMLFSGKERRVRLQGEAWFEVAKSAEIPFYVMAEDLEIRVYGTSFNVNTHGMRAVQTVLTEGEVGVRSLRSGKEVRMVPGQLAEYGRSDRELRIREVNVRQYTAWKEGYFYFDDRSLEEMMDELARWYDMEIVYQSNHGKMLHFSGYVQRYKDVRRILATLTEAVGIRFKVTGNRIIINN